MRRLDATVFFYLSFETNRGYHAKSVGFELPSLAGIRAAVRRTTQTISRQLESALTGMVLGRGMAWGVG